MYDYQTLTLTNIDGSISPFANGASGLILLGTGSSTPPEWGTLASVNTGLSDGIARLSNGHIVSDHIGLGSSDVTGILPVNKGGTGANSLTGILIGNGTSAISAVSTSGVSNGDVLAKTAGGYAFVPIGSTTVPPIIDLQSGATSANIGQFLKVNNDLEPEWADIGTIVGDYLPLAGGAMNGTDLQVHNNPSVLSTWILETSGNFTGLAHEAPIQSPSFRLKTKIGIVGTSLGDYAIRIHGYNVNNSAETLDFTVYLSNTINGNAGQIVQNVRGWKNNGSIVPYNNKIKVYQEDADNNNCLSIEFIFQTQKYLALKADLISHDLTRTGIVDTSSSSIDHQLIIGWEFVNYVGQAASGSEVFEPSLIVDALPQITSLPSGTNTATNKILLGGSGINDTPTWALLTAIPTGLSDNVAKISGGKLTSGSVNLDGNDVAGVLPISKGGTGLNTVGTANQVLTSNGSQMVWANKANAAVTADKVAHRLGFTVNNSGVISTVYFDGSSDIDGSNLLPIQKYHSTGILAGQGTAWTRSIVPSNDNQVLVSLTSGDTWDFEFRALSTVLPAITGLSSDSTNSGYLLTVGSSPGYAPTWIPRTDLNIPSAPSSLPLVDNETGALGTSGTYANADHQHPLPYAVQAAYKFFYPRKIGIGGAVTAEAQEYDGTADLILKVTEIDPNAIINTVPIEKGGTGASTASQALTNLGAAASNHNHDSTYLKLSGGNMTGTINTPANIVPLNWVGKSGVATFVSGDLTAQDNVNSYVTGRRQNINLYDSDVSADSASPTTINHTAKNNTTVNIVCGINEVRRYTRYINLPTPTADMLGDTITIYFTNQKPSVIAELFATCSTNYRIKSYDYSNFGNTAGVDANCKWSSGNVVQFTCINLENNGTTYYWRAVKLVEQSW